MAQGLNSGHDREAMLRRVAIVLSSLPAAVAAGLLGSIAPDSKQAVRRAMRSLDDVDPLELRRAFQAFKISVEQQHRATQTAGPQAPINEASIDQPLSSPASGSRVVSGDSIRRHAATGDYTANATRQVNEATTPMSFLEDVDDGMLLQLLRGEHPQTVALVLASISPATAGRVLPQLDARTQTETLSRIGRIQEFPDTAIEEVADHFRKRILEQTNNDNQRPGRTALDAILAAMPEHARQVAGSQVRAAAETVSWPAAADFPTAEAPQHELMHKLRLAEHTRPPARSAGPLPPNRSTTQQSASQIDASQQSPVRSNSTQPFDSTDSIARHLEQLTPADLCQALGQVDTRIAVLALCGVPNATAESALSLLPKAEARRVRSAMISLGSLNLRDIDDAKEMVARASVSLARAVPTAA